MPAHATVYRVYSFDFVRRRVEAEFINAASDEQAIDIVEAGEFGHKCEIWHGRRLVAQIEAERRQA